MIGLVYIGDINDCPYVNNYISCLKKEKMDYKIVFWNRKLINFKNNENYSCYISYNRKLNNSRPKILKIFPFLFFRKWLKKTLKKNDFKKIVFLSTLSALILPRRIVKKYNNRYILEIRDYTLENNIFFSKRLTRFINFSYFTSISSAGFKEFLPQKYEYILCHNTLLSDKFVEKANVSFDTYKILWNGMIRYIDNDLLLIKSIANNKKFELIFYGDGHGKKPLENYCALNNVKNVVFKGRYDNNDKPKILEQANILHNNYGKHPEMELKYALSNKYYDSLNYGIIQIVEPNTYKASLVNRYNLGLVIDFEKEDISDSIKKGVNNFDFDKFNKNRKILINQYREENNFYFKKIEEFLSEN